MSSGESNPFLISGPPGVVPEKKAEPVEPVAEPVDPESFITLPPGIVDSSTFRIETPREAREVAETASDIVFFPVLPGVKPIQASDAAAPDDAASVIAASVDAASSDPGETRAVAPRHVAAGWHLILPGSGQDVPVTDSIFIGRNPSRTADRPQADLLAPDDPAKSLSKTHAMLEVQDGALWVHDLNSTNGVFVAAPGVDAIEVQPGTRCEVPSGAELEL
ncbi:MAG: hypothetical protein JWO10_844, partial [Microbacteriaceae bacterium]|nr:hypothetical protein [Microbacteriaceae bacterium]